MALRHESEGRARIIAAREQKAALRKQRVIVKYGEVLGEAYLGYLYASGTSEEKAEQREAFADALVTVLETGTHEEKVKGMTALLDSFEAKIAPVARQAAKANSWITPI